MSEQEASNALAETSIDVFTTAANSGGRTALTKDHAVVLRVGKALFQMSAGEWARIVTHPRPMTELFPQADEVCG